MPDLPESILQCMKDGEFQVKKEAAWTYCNICTGGRPEHVQCVVQRYGVIQPLVDLLKLDDVKLTIAVLVRIFIDLVGRVHSG